MLRVQVPSATPGSVEDLYGGEVYFSDGYPIEFSWPILPSTLDPTEFELTLNNGEKVTPQVASIWPNFEYKERSVPVIFGHFGNRIPRDEAGLIWPVSIEVVEDDTPLILVGPGGSVTSAVGLAAQSPPPSSCTDPDAPPEDRGGLGLAAAKLRVTRIIVRAV